MQVSIEYELGVDGELPIAGKNPMLVRCKECNHIWVAIWLPCEAKALEQASIRQCPCCSKRATRNICMAWGAVDLQRFAVEARVIAAWAERAALAQTAAQGGDDVSIPRS